MQDRPSETFIQKCRAKAEETGAIYLIIFDYIDGFYRIPRSEFYENGGDDEDVFAVVNPDGTIEWN